MSETAPPTPRRKAVYAAVAFIGLLATLEVSARIFVSVAHVSKGRLRYDLAQSMYEPHPYVGYVCRPNTQAQGWRINNVGFRGDDISPAKPQGVFRIVAMGGSTTFGLKVGDEMTYPRQLQKMLTAALRGEPKVQVVNAGVPGYTTAESLTSLCFKVLSLSPDVVIVYHGINDVNPRVVPGYDLGYSHYRQPIELAFRKTLFDRALGWSYSYLVVRNMMLRNLDLTTVTTRQNPAHFSFAAQQANFDKTTPEAFRRNIRLIVRTCKANQITPVLVTFVVHRGLLNESKTMNPVVYAEGIRQHNAALREVAAKEGVLLVDLAKRFPQERRLFSGPVHMVEAGNRLKAKIIAEALLAAGLGRRHPVDRSPAL